MVPAANSGYSNRENSSKSQFRKSTFIPEEDECRTETNHVTRHVISGLCCRYVSNQEDISVIKDVPTIIEIDEDNNLFADSNNSFNDGSNNQNFEYDDHHRKHNNRYVAHDNDNENYQN